MPYALDVDGGESAGKHVRERKKRRPNVEEETDSGPQVHRSARESTVLSGTTSVFFKFRIYSKFTVSSVKISRFPQPWIFPAQRQYTTL